MHPEALRAVRDMIRDTETHWDRFEGLRALDLGGADVNGTARRWFHESTEWLGLDIAPGPGVDIVADATVWRGEPDPKFGYNPVHVSLPAFDIVLCTELLEHVKDWPAVLETIWHALVPGGYAFITCASEGRRPHGARGELNPPEGEHYGNISPRDFREHISTMYQNGKRFSPGGATYNPNPGDLYAWLRKAL